MSMATYMAVALEGNTSLDYWASLITTRGLYFVRDDLLGLCKFAGVTHDHAVEALKQEIGFDVTPAELLAAVRRAFVRALWLERKQGYDRTEYTLPSEVFDRPNPNLGVPAFVTREFFSELSDRVWAVFDPEIDGMANA
jgi:aldehyde:ferredoxin oxidoreductase